MYAGHLGIALSAKRMRPAVSLTALLLAAQGCDWIDAILMTRGWGYDQAEPWSHSLLSVVGATLLVGLVAWIWSRSGETALLVAATYLSHLPADLLTGEKPLFPGRPKVGLNMYAHPLLDFGVETIVVLIGWVLYRGTIPPGQRGRALALLTPATLIVLQLGADIVFLHRMGSGMATLPGIPWQH